MEKDTLIYAEEGFSKSDFLWYLFGTEDWSFVLAGFVFAVLGIALSNLLDRSVDNKNMLKKQNHNRLLISFLAVIVALRFSSEFMGGDLTMWYAFLFGLGSDKLVEILIKIKSGVPVTEALASGFMLNSKKKTE